MTDLQFSWIACTLFQILAAVLDGWLSFAATVFSVIFFVILAFHFFADLWRND